jgi:hypothetical protein
MKSLLAVIALLAAPAMAQHHAEPVCVRQEVVPGFEGWGKGTGTTLAINRAATLPLKPAATVRFTPPLSHKPAAGTYGGFYPLTVATAGRYRIALGERAWIDVVRGGKRLDSVAHGHGPACSGIAKIVGFDLRPGRYWIQLSDSKAPTAAVMVSGRRAR